MLRFTLHLYEASDSVFFRKRESFLKSGYVRLVSKSPMTKVWVLGIKVSNVS